MSYTSRSTHSEPDYLTLSVKKGKKVSITPISSTKNNTILGNSCARSNRLERSNRSSKTLLPDHFPDFHSVRRKVTFRMSDMIPSDINIHTVLQWIFCHMPFSYMASLVACFFNTSGRSRTPGSRAVRLGYLQSIKRDTQPLGSPRYSCHTDLSDRQFVRPLVFDILCKSRQFPYRAPSARLRF